MKVAWKIALNILPKKCLSEYQQIQENSMAKYAQNSLRMHLLQSRISKFSGRGPPYSPPTREGGTLLSGSPPLAPTALGSCLWHSTLPLFYELRLLLQFFLRTLHQCYGNFVHLHGYNFTLILEYEIFSTVTVKCRTAIKVLFLYFNLCLSVTLDSL